MIKSEMSLPAAFSKCDHSIVTEGLELTGAQTEIETAQFLKMYLMIKN